ncbi:ADP-dependent glucokinase/phosphofructokinase [Gryllotalpicola koreensis]|uniref:ADP-dependent phosphofructokinase/glucokinase n=1 Tax=Gryllotalpicola koreensis TaxID=993086 RepID=A0ABP8A5B3_9MICO
MPSAKRLSTDADAPAGPGRAVLGFGGTVDHEIEWDAALVARLAEEYRIRLTDCDPDAPIVDERSLLAVILGHARLRRGGERFVESPAALEQFAARHRKSVTIGGTCVRAGLVMRALGVRSTALLVAVDDTFLERFPPDCDYLVSDDAAVLIPHLIVQLPEAGSIPVADGEIVIDRPNRLIFVNDPAQSSMELSPDLGDTLAGAEVFLISGFNAMTDAALARRRIHGLRAAMRALPAEALVIYEDAGYHSAEVSAVARRGIVTLADVFSMNEDELQEHLGHEIDLLDPTAICDALGAMHRMFPGPTLVVHTRHWALASGARAPLLEGALAGGIRAATARYMHGDAATAADIAAVDGLSVPPEHRIVADALTATDPNVLRCIPAYAVPTSKPTTIGLGDSFVGGLAAGLVSARRAEGALS